MVFPAVIATVFVDAKIARPNGRCREIWHYDSEMPAPRDHGIATVRVALPCDAGMGMNVGHHGKSGLTAARPQPRKAVAVKDANARVVGVRIEVLIEDCHDDFGTTFHGSSQQEGTGLVSPLTAPVEFGQCPPP